MRTILIYSAFTIKGRGKKDKVQIYARNTLGQDHAEGTQGTRTGTAGGRYQHAGGIIRLTHPPAPFPEGKGELEKLMSCELRSQLINFSSHNGNENQSPNLYKPGQGEPGTWKLWVIRFDQLPLLDQFIQGAGYQFGRPAEQLAYVTRLGSADRRQNTSQPIFDGLPPRRSGEPAAPVRACGGR